MFRQTLKRIYASIKLRLYIFFGGVALAVIGPFSIASAREHCELMEEHLRKNYYGVSC